MSAIDLFMPFVVIALWPAGYFLGRKVRDFAHVMIPFKDPVSLLILFLGCALMCLPVYHLGLDWQDQVTVWTLSSTLGFLLGYIIGYCSIGIDVVQVAVHSITQNDMESYPLVYYYSREGRLCWQPQDFRSIFKSMVLGVHNPLNFPLGSIYRKRHIYLRTLFMKQEVDVVDLAGMEVNETEVVKGRIHFRVEARKYIPSPNCTDAPYDWIVRASEYEDVFMKFSEVQVEAIEAKAALSRAAVRGGGEILTALGAKNPSQWFMDDLGIDLRKSLNQDAVRKVRREMARAPAIDPEEAYDGDE